MTEDDVSIAVRTRSPSGGGWAVRREGAATTNHSTKGDAVRQATSLARNASGQVAIHTRDGRISAHRTYGLPKVQDPPRESRLGRERIQKAVSRVVMERLSSAPVSPGAPAPEQ